MNQSLIVLHLVRPIAYCHSMEGWNDMFPTFRFVLAIGHYMLIYSM